MPENIKASAGYAVSLRRRKMIEEAFGWVKEIGMLGRISCADWTKFGHMPCSIRCMQPDAHE